MVSTELMTKLLVLNSLQITTVALEKNGDFRGKI
jgi:hypothetical protein